MLRLPEPGSGEPAVGYAGAQGIPVQVDPDQHASEWLVEGRGSRPAAPVVRPAYPVDGVRAGRRCRFGRRSLLPF